MNSLGIKRGEERRQLSRILIRLFPYLASFALVMIFVIFTGAPFTSPYFIAVIPALYLGLLLTPFILFCSFAYVLIAYVSLAVTGKTALKAYSITKHFVVAGVTGLILFVTLSFVRSRMEEASRSEEEFLKTAIVRTQLQDVRETVHANAVGLAVGFRSGIALSEGKCGFFGG